jgi:hypothetical protein
VLTSDGCRPIDRILEILCILCILESVGIVQHNHGIMEYRDVEPILCFVSSGMKCNVNVLGDNFYGVTVLDIVIALKCKFTCDRICFFVNFIP